MNIEKNRKTHHKFQNVLSLCLHFSGRQLLSSDKYSCKIFHHCHTPLIVCLDTKILVDIHILVLLLFRKHTSQMDGNRSNCKDLENITESNQTNTLRLAREKRNWNTFIANNHEIADCNALDKEIATTYEIQHFFKQCIFNVLYFQSTSIGLGFVKCKS